MCRLHHKPGVTIMFKSLAAAALAVALTACGSIAHEVASGVNNAQLKSTVGKSYAQVVYERPDLGKLVGRETVGSGDQIMKHIGDFGAAQSSYGGIYGKQEHQARAVYFLVDGKGVVKDWATELYKAGSSNCWVGICNGQKTEQVPTEELDRIVKTSSGAPLVTWRNGRQ